MVYHQFLYEEKWYIHRLRWNVLLCKIWIYLKQFSTYQHNLIRLYYISFQNSRVMLQINAQVGLRTVIAFMQFTRIYTILTCCPSPGKIRVYEEIAINIYFRASSFIWSAIYKSILKKILQTFTFFSSFYSLAAVKRSQISTQMIVSRFELLNMNNMKRNWECFCSHH